MKKEEQQTLAERIQNYKDAARAAVERAVAQVGGGGALGFTAEPALQALATHAALLPVLVELLLLVDSEKELVVVVNPVKLVVRKVRVKVKRKKMNHYIEYLVEN